MRVLSVLVPRRRVSRIKKEKYIGTSFRQGKMLSLLPDPSEKQSPIIPQPKYFQFKVRRRGR